jgi:hypothetical protein
MDLQQKFNLQLMRALKNIGVSFAHPTRTIHVTGQPGSALAAMEPEDGPPPVRPPAGDGSRPSAQPS